MNYDKYTSISGTVTFGPYYTDCQKIIAFNNQSVESAGVAFAKLEMHNLKKTKQTIMYPEKAKKRTSLGANLFWDEHYQVPKVVYIIAPVECYIAGRDISNQNGVIFR